MDDVLDLRHDPWQVLEDEFGLDPDDYDVAPGLDHHQFQEFEALYVAAGYLWVRWLESGVGGEEWMQLRA